MKITDVPARRWSLIYNPSAETYIVLRWPDGAVSKLMRALPSFQPPRVAEAGLALRDSESGVQSTQIDAQNGRQATLLLLLRPRFAAPRYVYRKSVVHNSHFDGPSRDPRVVGRTGTLLPVLPEIQINAAGAALLPAVAGAAAGVTTAGVTTAAVATGAVFPRPGLVHGQGPALEL